MTAAMILPDEGIATMTDSADSRRSATPDSNAGVDSGLVERALAGWAWLQRELWAYDPKAPILVRVLRSAAQLVTLTAKGFQDDQLLLRASALTYVTALCTECTRDGSRLRRAPGLRELREDWWRDRVWHGDLRAASPGNDAE